jgi:hypothetical protein
MLRKSGLVESVTLGAQLDDLAELLPLLQEIADQAGVLMQMKESGGLVSITLTSSARRPV